LLTVRYDGDRWAAQIHDDDPGRDDHCICGGRADRCSELEAIADEIPAMRE
jgi:hypothetical protein